MIFKMTGIYDGKIISFAEIFQGSESRDASVRVTEDGFLYAVDLVMVMTGKNCNDSGQVLRRLVDQASGILTDRPSVTGGYPTKLISFNDSIKLVMILPGEKAKGVKTQFAEIIQRYIAGDRSLIYEIKTNSSSTNPISRLASMTLPAGVKRGHIDLDECPNNADFGEFVRKSFEYQKEVIELSHKYDLILLKTGKAAEEIDELAHGLIINEGAALECKLKESKLHIEQLQAALQNNKYKIQETEIKRADMIYSLKNMQVQ